MSKIQVIEPDMNEEIDERYSRQILSLGFNSQLKLSNGIIRINNLSGGLSTEVCKNLVLQGIGTIILNDQNKINETDLECGFYYTNSLNNIREQVLKENLQKLNPSCKIYLNNEYKNKIDLEIFLNMVKDNDSEIPYIYSRVGGCRGFIFNDFKNHIIESDEEIANINFNQIKSELENPSLHEDWVKPDKPLELFNYWKKNELNPEDKLELSGVNCYFGGLIASEAIKFITKKDIPIKQWYFWEDTSYLNYYDFGRNMIEKIVGKENYEQMINANWFMVGSGAIGCEMIKNVSLMNISTKDGMFYLTDPDTIEVSNLSRQFLFHSEDLNNSKSIVAGSKVKKFNNNFNVLSYQDKMCPETENIYDDKFYNNLDGIINALDNYEARLYMDKKAIEYGLPLFESGTQGTKGNTQVIIPYLTENYGATSDPPESESYPLCTLKNFPNKPEHVIHYIKEMFNEWLSDFPNKVNRYIENNIHLEELTEIEKLDLINKMNKFFKYSNKVEDQIKFWNEFYYQNFRDNILQILENYPEDHTIDDEPFWKNGKVCPQVPNEELKKDFIKYSLKISERLYDVNYDYDESILDNLEILDPKISKVKIAIKEEDLKNQEKFDDEELNVIPNVLNMINFDKDLEVDYNWLYQGTKIRSETYKIEMISKLKVRQISGKIIPALATTTSIVSGLISLEILKYYNKSKIEDYRSYFLDTSLNQLLYSEPNSVKKNKIGELEVSIWDKFVETTDQTIEELINKYNIKFKTEISIVVSESKVLYAPFISEESDKLKKLSELDLGNNFEIVFSNDDEQEFPIVYVKI